MDDSALLRQFAENNSDEAFAALVTRHVNLAYSVALRQAGNPHHAEEITQAVFIILAKKAAQLRHHKALSSWLFQTTRLATGNFLRSETRRLRREQEAYMQSILNESGNDVWLKIAPLLDSAVANLREKDRRAILLRFYEGKNLREVGDALQIKEDAAEKRVSRALEKLRKFFAKHGVDSTAAIIAEEISTNSINAAPIGLAKTISTVAMVKSAAIVTSNAELIKRTIRALTRAKYKFLIIGGATALVVGTAIVIGLPKKPANPSIQMPQATNTSTAIREPLEDSMMFALDVPPGGLAIQPDGKIVVGTTLSGFFLDAKSGMIGVYKRALMRLNPDGSLDRTFLAGAGNPANCDPARAHVIVLPKGKIFASGLFSSVGRKPRPGYAMFLPDGKLDLSFEPWRGSTNVPQKTYLPGGTFPATWLADGSVAIMSDAMKTRPGWHYPLTVYHLDSTGKWVSPATHILTSEFFRPSGLILTLGPVGFSARTTIDWNRDIPATRRPPIPDFAERPVSDMPFQQWIEPPSAPDAAKVFQALFEEVPIELCRYAVQMPDGGAILAIRDKADTGMTAPGRFMRFDKNWKPDFSFTNFYEANLRSELRIKRQKDGRFLVSGLIGKMNGEDFPGIVRLDENGQIDPDFHCVIGPTNSRQGLVMDFAIQDDGRIVICGWFSSVNGVEMPHIARLNSDGSLDQTFKPSFVTLEQFDRNRFANRHRVPVVQLSSTTTNPNVNAPPRTILIVSMALENGVATIRFTGASNQQYILQARDSLNDSSWGNISTNRTTINGTGIISDTDANDHPMRFYRIAEP